MTKLNSRYALEQNGVSDGFRIIDLFTQTSVGDFWSYDGVWVFTLNDGRSRFGGYTKVLRSLRLMLQREPDQIAA